MPGRLPEGSLGRRVDDGHVLLAVLGVSDLQPTEKKVVAIHVRVLTVTVTMDLVDNTVAVVAVAVAEKKVFPAGLFQEGGAVHLGGRGESTLVGAATPASLLKCMDPSRSPRIILPYLINMPDPGAPPNWKTGH